MINFILNTKSKYVIMYANNIGGKAMKKIICRREYDTDTATLVKKYTEGEFGEAEGFEESPLSNRKRAFLSLCERRRKLAVQKRGYKVRFKGKSRRMAQSPRIDGAV